MKLTLISLGNKNFSQSSNIFLVLSIFWTAFIFYSSLIPSDNLPEKQWMTKIYFDKIVHFVFYYLLMTFYLSFLMKLDIENALYLKLTWIALILVMAIGISIEFLQTMKWTNRDFELNDIIINITGACVAFTQKTKLKF